MLIVAACFAGAALLCAGVCFLVYANSQPGPAGWVAGPAVVAMQVGLWGAVIFGALAILSFLFWLLPVLASMAGG